MPFSSSTIEYLKGKSKTIFYTLEVKSSHPESSAWKELPLTQGGFSLTNDREELGSTLVFTVPSDDLRCFAELDPTNALALFSEVRLTAKVQAEQEVLFRGFILELSEEMGIIRAFCVDHCYRLMRALCAVNVEGDRTAQISNAPLVPLTAEYDDHTYGLDRNLTPEGFSPEGKRRAWKLGVAKIFDGNSEVLPDFYRVYPSSGVVRFLDPLPRNPTISGISCFIEGTSDVAEALAQILGFPREKGGAGIPSSEIELAPLSFDLNSYFLARGEALASDAIENIKEVLSQNYRFYYDSDAGKFKHTLLVQDSPPARELINLASLTRVRSRENLFTRVVVRGKRVTPVNLALNASLTDLQDGVGEVFRWNGSEKLFGEGSIGLIRDGDDNSGFGRHNAPYPYEFQDFALFDLGLDADGNPPIISSIEITASNSKNVNSTSSSNAKFLYGYEILVSGDGINYEAFTPEGPILLRPLERARVYPPKAGPARFVKIRVKPAKDGVSNENDPGLALNEIRIYGEEFYLAEARVQGTDPFGEFYYPELLEKTQGVGTQALLLDVGDSLAETEALKLAKELLKRAITDYFAYEATCISDPTLKVGDSVLARHPVTGEQVEFLVERIELTPNVSRVFGKDYNAMVLK